MFACYSTYDTHEPGELTRDTNVDEARKDERFAMNVAHLLATYGYGAVFLCITIESTGIPFPGETMLLVAAIYAGTTHQLSIPLIIVAAASGAILGDNIGFWVGREGGFRLLRRYGHYIHLNERKLKIGLYLFRRH